MKKILLTALLCLGIGQAGAATITFNELTTTNYFNPVNPLTSGGFLFSNSQNTNDALGVWNTSGTDTADPGFAAVFVNYGFTTTTMTQVGGGAFDFTSIGLADVYDNGVASTIAFTFNYFAGGNSTQSVTLDSLIGQQTFAFNQTALASVSWVTTAGDGGWNQFDNVVVNGNQVPEPASLALMGLGLAAFAARRRKV